jgi:hypothetical protein
MFQGESIDNNPSINEDIGIFEENIENGNEIENDNYFDEDIMVIEGNLFGQIGYIICQFFVNLVTGFIKLIIKLIGKII